MISKEQRSKYPSLEERGIEFTGLELDYPALHLAVPAATRPPFPNSAQDVDMVGLLGDNASCHGVWAPREGTNHLHWIPFTKYVCLEDTSNSSEAHLAQRIERIRQETLTTALMSEGLPRATEEDFLVAIATTTFDSHWAAQNLPGHRDDLRKYMHATGVIASLCNSQGILYSSAITKTEVAASGKRIDALS